MKIAVLGGGVIGVTTAHYLARDGHEVTVVERRPAVATGASWGNAGLISPSDAYAWASPDALKMAIRSLWRKDLGIRYQLRLDPRLWWWSLQFLMQCPAGAVRRNTLTKLRLLSYSQDCINDVAAEAGIDYAQRHGGILYCFRSETGLRAAAAHMSILQDQGLELRRVDRDEMVALEPMLGNSPKVAGGIYSPGCQTGSSHLFTARLAEWNAQNLGVKTAFDTTVKRLEVEGDRISRAVTDKGTIEADAFVLAAGAESVFVAKTAGLRLPIYPVKGFSITAPLREPRLNIGMGVVDEDRLVAMTPMKDRVRAAGCAVFGGFDYGHKPEDFNGIRQAVRDVFGGAVDLEQADYWTGLRPMTPASVPILGPTRHHNLYLNVGHGHVGWSMCCGSAKIVADLIAGRKTDIDLTGLVATP